MALGILNQRTVRSFILTSFERTMLIVAERFIAYLIDKYGKHPISTDGGTWYYPPQQACHFLKLDHHIHSFYEKPYQKDNSINTSRIELQKDLMTISHVKRKIAS